MLPPATLPHGLAPHKHSTPKNKQWSPKTKTCWNISQSLCGPFTPLAVFEMLWNGSRKCTRGSLTSCMLHASGCALWGRTIMPQHVKLFAAFALAFRRSWGMGSCWYEGLPDSLFSTSHPCSVFLTFFWQHSSSYWKARKCQNMPAMRANPVSQEPFGTVRNRSWPFLAHGVLQLYMYNAAKLYFIVFWPLFHCARTGRERFWTVPDCSWFTGIPEFYCVTWFATISYWLSFFILTYGQCCHVAMALFSAFGKFKTEGKNHRRTFPKHSLSVARGRIEPDMACGSG